MKSLGLHRNLLEGSVPSGIGRLTKHATIRYVYKSFSGTIPSEIGELTNLEMLYMQFNNIHGTIPSDLGNCIMFT